MEAQSPPPPSIGREAAKPASPRASVASHHYQLPVVRELPPRLERVDDRDCW